MIEFLGVSKHYPNRQGALKDVRFKIRSGEMAFITGHSGAGKSTLLKLLMLIEKPSSGRINIGGENWNQVTPDQVPLFRRRIGMVHQNNLLIPNKTVFENIALPMEICGAKPSEIAPRVKVAMTKVGLASKSEALPDMLSLGEQQRVGIARAVVNRPQILIADEPTGNLDPTLSEKVMDLFINFAKAGVTVIVASHDRNLISRYKQRTIILNEGNVLYDTDSERGFA